MEKYPAGYEAVDAPKGIGVDSLPDGYKTVTVDGENFYELDGIYYMPSKNEAGDDVLVVVDNPLE